MFAQLDETSHDGVVTEDERSTLPAGICLIMRFVLTGSDDPRKIPTIPQELRQGRDAGDTSMPIRIDGSEQGDVDRRAFGRADRWVGANTIRDVCP